MRKKLFVIIVLLLAIFLSACSYGYDVLIVNESSHSIEIRYELNQQGSDEKPLIQSFDDWKKGVIFNPDKVIEYEIKQGSNERIIKLPAKTVLKIDSGNWNPVAEEKGELSHITEIHIISQNGEVSYKGKLVLTQFEKNNTTFTKIIRDEFTN